MPVIRSWFSRRPASARRRWGWGLAAGAILTAMTLAAVPPAAQATTTPAHAAMPTATKYEQISTNQGGSSLCMNRNGGGTSQGTFIIGYNCGVSGNDFEYVDLVDECDTGTVSRSEECPFTNHALNAYYDGADIVEVFNYTTALCAGTATSSTFTLRLETCPTNGNAGWNTLMVAPGARTNFPDCLISIHSTNAPGVGDSTIYAASETGYEGGIALNRYTYTSGCPTSAQWHVIQPS